MKLKAHMIKVNYFPEIDLDSKELLIKNIKILDENHYKKGTILGDDDKEYWYSYTHYRSKDDDYGMYQLGFELMDFEEGKNCEDYTLCILSNYNTELSYSLKYDRVHNIFFEPVKGKMKKGKIEYSKRTADIATGTDTAGLFELDILENSTGVKVYNSPPIVILPSSMSYDDYKSMIDDLLQIKDDLVTNEKSKIALKGRWNYRKESILECLDYISNSIERINKKPAVNLSGEWKKDIYKPNKYISPRTLIENNLAPHKNKYNSQRYVENTDIYENRMIKYALSRLKNKVIQYSNYYEREVNQNEKEITAIKDKIEEKNNKSIESKLEELNTKIQIIESNIIKDETECIDNIDKMWNNSIAPTGNVELHFTIYKEAEFDKKNINVKIWRQNCKIELNTYKSNSLCLNYKEYKYNINGLWEESQFEARVGTINMQSSNLNEIVFLIEEILENKNLNSSITIHALGQRTFLHTNDPIGGQYLSGYTSNRPIKNYTINLTKIYSINNKNTPLYSLNHVIDKLFLYRTQKELDFWKQSIETLSEEKSFINSIINKQNISTKEKNDFLKIGGNWEDINKRVEELLRLDMFKKVKNTHCIWKPTQIFVNEPDYKFVRKHLKDLDYKIDFISSLNSKKFAINVTHNIYEYWCFFKMIQILINEQNWNIENHEEMLEWINFNRKNDDLKVILSHQITDETKITITIWHDKKIYYNETNHKRPDYTLEIEFDNKVKRVYMDAKYKNYSEQTSKEWFNDFKGVAIDKYILTFENTAYEPISSFIIHPDTKEKWTFFGGSLNKNQKEKLGWEGKAPNHRFGTFSFVPSQTMNFRIFFKMILEYHLGLYDYCWNCGETVHSEEKIDKEVKKTVSGFDKYHYTCGKCGEFWVKTHCNTTSHHDLIKHLNNYHSPTENKNIWFVDCPKC